MRHKINLVSFLILGALSSCSEFMPGNGCFTVKEVEETKKESTYRLIQTEGRGSTTFRDSVGRYHVGDTLCVCGLRR